VFVNHARAAVAARFGSHKYLSADTWIATRSRRTTAGAEHDKFVALAAKERLKIVSLRSRLGAFKNGCELALGERRPIRWIVAYIARLSAIEESQRRIGQIAAVLQATNGPHNPTLLVYDHDPQRTRLHAYS